MLNWKRIFVAPLLLLLPIAAFGQLDVGDRLNSDQIPKGNSLVCAASPSQMYPCVVDLTVSGVKFNTVGYDAKTRRVKYLSTSDSQFRTKEGLRVGDWIEMSEDQVISFPGWLIYGPETKGGWHIVVGNTLSAAEKVQFQDGTVVYPSAVRSVPPRTGKVRIRQFEKGGL